jgi:hypothetical protein
MKVALNTNTFTYLEFLDSCEGNVYSEVYLMPVIVISGEKATQDCFIQCEYYRETYEITTVEKNRFVQTIKAREIGFMKKNDFIPVIELPLFDLEYSEPNQVTRYGCRADQLIQIG